MSLMRILSDRQMLGNIKRRRHTSAVYLSGRDIRQILLRQTDYSSEVILPLNEEYHISRLIEPARKRKDIFGAKATQQLRLTQDVPPQRVVTENHILEIIEYQFRRSVFVWLDFINDNLRFLLNLVLGKSGMKHNIPQQFERPFQMFGQESGIDYRFFFIGVGIQVAAYILHPVKDVPGFPLLRPLKDEMLHKMSHPLFVLRLIACSGIDGKTTISYFRESRFMDNTKAIR